MDSRDLLLWLYEQKDDIDAHLYGLGIYNKAEGDSRLEYFAQLNTINKVIKHIKDERKC